MCFWLTDGGWLTEQVYNRTGTASVTATPLTNLPGTPLVSSAVINSTCSAFGSGFMALFGSTLLSGPVMSQVTGGKVAANVTSAINATLSNGTINTRYPALNGVIVDIFEGQLLMALIASSFILIVFIRGLVVQHQPMRIVLIRPARDPGAPLADEFALAGMLHNVGPGAPLAIARQDAEDEFVRAGMLHKVEFILVCITTTVALGVAFPYVMGKIVLIILVRGFLLRTRSILTF